jgi:hypothetical protein
VDAFFSKSDEFHKPPRSLLWKSVNLAASIPGWTRFPAAEDWTADFRARRVTAEEPKSKQFVNDTSVQPSAAEFQEFESWKSSAKERRVVIWIIRWCEYARGTGCGCRK